MARKYWKDEYEYKRILEILSDYWLTEDKEEVVVIDMYFKHKYGQEQWKRICWRHPDFLEWHPEEKGKPLHGMTFAELVTMEDARDYYERGFEDRFGKSDDA